LLAEIIALDVEQRGEWVTQLALELSAADEEKARLDFSRKLILEAKQFKKKKSEAGSSGANKRWGNNDSSAIAVPKQCDGDAMANDSQKQKHKQEAIKKEKYGEFKNVLLTAEEIEKLQTKLNGSCSDYIERLSAYLAQSGKKYKSHYATILTWHRSDEKKTETVGTNPMVY